MFSCFLLHVLDEDNSLSQVVIDANDGTKGEVAFNLSSAHVIAEEVFYVAAVLPQTRVICSNSTLDYFDKICFGVSSCAWLQSLT